jgi:hypothetical protein
MGGAAPQARNSRTAEGDKHEKRVGRVAFMRVTPYLIDPYDKTAAPPAAGGGALAAPQRRGAISFVFRSLLPKPFFSGFL